MKNMNLCLRAYELVVATLVCFSTTLIVGQAHAAVDESTDLVEDMRPVMSDIVELHVPVDVTASYRDRRNRNGFLFGLNYESVFFGSYTSAINAAYAYENMFGRSEIPFYQLELGYKFNFSGGALAANVTYGMGKISGNDSGVMRTLEMTKMAVSGSYIMDNLFKEPYVAPYISFGAMEFGINETDGTDTASGNTQMAYFYTAGVLVQLNWIDKNVSRESLRDYGLQNTYLDFFISKYTATSAPDDPNTATDYNLGAGIRLEF